VKQVDFYSVHPFDGAQSTSLVLDKDMKKRRGTSPVYEGIRNKVLRTHASCKLSRMKF
jgi:hypothetical protein